MNIDDKQIDKLTRDLMKGATEKPSTSLMGRIMVRVMQEHQATRRIQVTKSPVLKWIFGGLFVYIILALCSFNLFLAEPTAVMATVQIITTYFPVIITFIVSISLFIIFAQLDNWLRINKDFKASK